MRLSARSKAASGVAGVAGAAVIAMATQFIVPWEGKRNHAYLDTIARPAVWTVCYGETDPKYAFKGAYYTDTECKDMLTKRVAYFYARMENVAKTDAIPVSVQAAMLELLYNIGEGQFNASTILQKANAGDYLGACQQLDRWVKSGGKTIRGLVNRRNASEEMCMQDVKK